MVGGLAIARAGAVTIWQHDRHPPVTTAPRAPHSLARAGFGGDPRAFSVRATRDPGDPIGQVAPAPGDAGRIVGPAQRGRAPRARSPALRGLRVGPRRSAARARLEWRSAVGDRRRPRRGARRPLSPVPAERRPADVLPGEAGAGAARRRERLTERTGRGRCEQRAREPIDAAAGSDHSGRAG